MNSNKDVPLREERWNVTRRDLNRLVIQYMVKLIVDLKSFTTWNWILFLKIALDDKGYKTLKKFRWKPSK